MTETADRKREILRGFMTSNRLKAASWTRSAGVSSNVLYNFLNGHSAALDATTYAKLADAANVPSHQLTGDLPATSPTTVWVAGHVEAGAFREAVEWDRSLWYAVDVPIPVRFRGKTRALEIRGRSMNDLYPEGTVILWVECIEFRAPRHGDRVIVYSHATDDGIEATVKELREIDHRRWLWPRSSDPDHQSPIDPHSPPPGVARVEIAGIVIGSYRPEAYW